MEQLLWLRGGEIRLRHQRFELSDPNEHEEHPLVHKWVARINELSAWTGAAERRGSPSREYVSHTRQWRPEVLTRRGFL